MIVHNTKHDIVEIKVSTKFKIYIFLTVFRGQKKKNNNKCELAMNLAE